MKLFGIGAFVKKEMLTLVSERFLETFYGKIIK